jgi:hypothetical protein
MEQKNPFALIQACENLDELALIKNVVPTFSLSGALRQKVNFAVYSG